MNLVSVGGSCTGPFSHLHWFSLLGDSGIVLGWVCTVLHFSPSTTLDGLSLRLALNAPADGGGVWTATAIESMVHGAVRGTALDEGTMGLTSLGQPFGSVLACWGQV